MNHQDIARALHEGLAQELLDRLESGEVTTSDINQIRQFLKDNNVTGLAYAPKALRELDTEIEFKDPDAGVQLRPVRDGS